MNDKEIKFKLTVDSDFDKVIDDIQQRLKETTAPLDMMKSQMQSQQKRAGQGIEVSAPTREEYKKASNSTRRELDKSIKDEVKANEQLAKDASAMEKSVAKSVAQHSQVTEKLKEQESILKKIDKAKNPEKYKKAEEDVLSTEKKQLEIVEKIAKQKEFIAKSAELYKQRDQAIDTMFQSKERLKPQGMERLMEAYKGGGVQGVLKASGRMVGEMNPGTLLGVAGAVLSGIGSAGQLASQVYRGFGRAPIETEAAIGSATQNITGKEAQNIYGRRSAFEMPFADEKAKAAQMSLDALKNAKRSDLADIGSSILKAGGAGMAKGATYGAGIGAAVGGVAAGIAAGGATAGLAAVPAAIGGATAGAKTGSLIGAGLGGLMGVGSAAFDTLSDPRKRALMLSPFSDTMKAQYESLTTEQAGKDFRDSYENLKAQNPFKVAATQEYEKTFKQDLVLQRHLGLRDEGFYGKVVPMDDVKSEQAEAQKPVTAKAIKEATGTATTVPETAVAPTPTVEEQKKTPAPKPTEKMEAKYPATAQAPPTTPAPAPTPTPGPTPTPAPQVTLPVPEPVDAPKVVLPLPEPTPAPQVTLPEPKSTTAQPPAVHPEPLKVPQKSAIDFGPPAPKPVEPRAPEAKESAIVPKKLMDSEETYGPPIPTDDQRQQNAIDTNDRSFEQRAIDAKFLPEQAKEAAGQIFAAGGSTRMARESTFALKAQRGLGVENAPQALGTMSQTLGGAGSTEQAFIKVMSAAMSKGLDDSKFAEEQMKFVQVTSELVARSGAKTSEDAGNVAQKFSGFIADKTGAGIDAAKSAYEEYQKKSAETTGPTGVMRAAGYMSDPKLKNLSTMTKQALMRIPENEFTESNPLVNLAAEEAGTTSKDLIKRNKDVTAGSQSRFKGHDEARDIVSRENVDMERIRDPEYMSTLKPEARKALRTMLATETVENDYGGVQKMVSRAAGQLPEKEQYGPAVSPAAVTAKMEAGAGETGRVGDKTIAAQSADAGLVLKNFNSMRDELGKSADATAKYTDTVRMLNAVMTKAVYEAQQTGKPLDTKTYTDALEVIAKQTKANQQQQAAKPSR